MSLKSIFLPKLKGIDEDKKKKNLVYSIPCMYCDKVYIEETSRMKVTRMKEQRAKIKTLSSDSKLVEHILKYKHNIDFSNTKTLAFESNWRKRIIKESILTNRTLDSNVGKTSVSSNSHSTKAVSRQLSSSSDDGGGGGGKSMNTKSTNDSSARTSSKNKESSSSTMGKVKFNLFQNSNI
ncbi:unnamed protein product [Rotaria sp. Silwood2]|nr:unnamed protein product [Rotaria sp. Silwood2]